MQTAWWVGGREVSSASSPLGTWPALRLSRASDSPSVPPPPALWGPGWGEGCWGKEEGRAIPGKGRRREGTCLPQASGRKLDRTCCGFWGSGLSWGYNSSSRGRTP